MKKIVLFSMMVSLVFILCACHSHSFAEWEVTEDATCTADGAQVSICQCGEKKYEIIPATGHDYSNGICKNCGESEPIIPCSHENLEKIDGKAATCSETGLTDGEKCLDCGVITKEQTELPLTAHTYDGDDDAICNICGNERDLSCTHNNIEILEGKEASCDEVGLSSGKKCLDCGEIIEEQQIISALEHIEGQPIRTTTKEPTCTEVGTVCDVVSCDRCGKVISTSNDIEIKSIVYELDQGHCFAGDKCKWCGADIPESSSGLVFQLNEDGESYSLIDASNCTEDHLIISSYKGLPVTRIAAGAFKLIISDDGNASVYYYKSVSIGDSVTTIDESAFQFFTATCINIGSGYVYNNSTIFALSMIFRFRVSEENPSLKVEGNSLMTKDGKSLVKAGWFGFDLINFIDNEKIFETESERDFINLIASYDYENYVNNCYIPEKFVLPESDNYREEIISAYECYTTPETVEHLEAGAFTLTYFKKAVITDNVVSYSDGPFTLSSINHLVLGNGIKEITASFASLSSIRTLTIGESVQAIDMSAFILSNIKEIINYSNIDLSEIKENDYPISSPIFVHSDKDSRITETDDGYVFIYDGTTNYLIDYIGKDTNLVLPESYNGETYVIASGAISSIDNIKSIDISDGVTAINENAIFACTNLLTITIDKNVTSVHERAFYSNDNLIEIVNNSNVDFSSSYDVQFIYPGESKIDVVGDYAFISHEGTNYLCKYLGEKLTSDTCFTLELPENYNGESYAIANNAFYHVKLLESIVIPEGVTEIGKYAFAWCESLKSIVIPESVTNIGSSAFTYCKSLTSIVIPKNVTKIGTATFSECNSLTSITLWGDVTTIDGMAFYGCYSLTDINIPKSVSSIGYYTFSGCTSLTNVYYEGNEEGWNEIDFGFGNENLQNANIIFNYVFEN